MPYMPTAPDVKTLVADRIRAHRKSRDNGDRWFLAYRNAREEAGRFTTARGGALVTVEALIAFSQRAIRGSDDQDGYEHRIHVAAEAKCHGHGCTEPGFRQDDTGHSRFLLDADADVTAEAVLPYVQKAREWALAHAGKCRATPHPAQPASRVRINLRDRTK